MANSTSRHTRQYYLNHHLVNKVRGPAKLRTCDLCGDRPARDWATPKGLDSERDQVDPVAFIAACRSCHRAYDGSMPNWLGRHHSAETREKLRVIKTGGSNHTPESRDKISRAMQGRAFSAQTRERMRQAQLGKKASAAARDKMSAGQRRRYGLGPGERASHGSTGYRKGCRCDECRQGHAAAERDRKARKAGRESNPRTR